MHLCGIARGVSRKHASETVRALDDQHSGEYCDHGAHDAEPRFRHAAEQQCDQADDENDHIGAHIAAEHNKCAADDQHDDWHDVRPVIFIDAALLGDNHAERHPQAYCEFHELGWLHGEYAEVDPSGVALIVDAQR